MRDAERSACTGAKRAGGKIGCYSSSLVAARPLRPVKQGVRSLLTTGSHKNIHATEIHTMRLRHFILLIVIVMFPQITHGGEYQALCTALYQQNYAETELALRHGADANTRCDWYGLPLHYTIQQLYPFQFVTLLIQYRADVNIIDNQGKTALHFATANQNIETSIQVTRYLVEQGAHINARDKFGQTPLHTAANIEVVKYLIAHGANVNVQDHNGWTPLHEAVFRDKANIVKILVEHGSHINAVIGKSVDWTPLDIATLYGYEGIREFLIEKGAIATNSLNLLSQEESKRLFKWARDEGSYTFMSLAVNHLAKLGVIHCGMLPEELIKILGEEDRTTGIYCPGGFSAGYGKGDPDSVKNYGDFYWVHYRSPDWLTDNPKEPELLIYWDMGDYVTCPGS
jgi:hypothetical protein